MKTLAKYRWFNVAACLLAAATFWYFAHRPKVTIGVEGQYQTTIKGEKLEAVPYTLEDALAVRIASAEPKGKGYRYDLRYMAYAPGEHDLVQYLLTPDGKPAEGVKPLKVNIRPLLEEDYSGTLFDSETQEIRLDSNYTWLMPTLWLLWLAVPIPLLLLGRKKRVEHYVETPAPTTTERLLELLHQAQSENLSTKNLADIEKLLLRHWSEQHGTDSERLVDALQQLRRHPEAAQQIFAVEKWLHSRDGGTGEDTIRELLASFGKGVAA
jgi:hypothetical protein